jgi:hypothetical protein
MLSQRVMDPEGPAGMLIQMSSADYVYYEEQTSAFHQAHIVLSLSARLLLGEGVITPIDMRLASQISPRTVHHMLGQSPGRELGEAQAETFASLVLAQGWEFYPPASALRALRQLNSLRIGLCGAVQEVNDLQGNYVRHTAQLRLYRRVIEIRDAMLSLKPYRDPRVAAAVTATARAAGLTGEERAAAMTSSQTTRDISVIGDAQTSSPTLLSTYLTADKSGSELAVDPMSVGVYSSFTPSMSTGIRAPSVPGAASPAKFQARCRAAARAERMAFSARALSPASRLMSRTRPGQRRPARIGQAQLAAPRYRPGSRHPALTSPPDQR